MKALIMFLGLMLIGSTVFSQLVKEVVITDNFKKLNLDGSETKFIKYQEKEKTLSIYNLDHSIWKTVELPLPKGHFLDEIKLISTNYFNEDNFIEIMFTSAVYNYSYNYENPAGDEQFVTYTLNIINEKGEVLLVEEEMEDYEILESDENNKLVVYKQNSNALDNKSQTVVYAIIGKKQFQDMAKSPQVPTLLGKRF